MLDKALARGKGFRHCQESSWSAKPLTTTKPKESFPKIHFILPTDSIPRRFASGELLIIFQNLQSNTCPTGGNSRIILEELLSVSEDSAFQMSKRFYRVTRDLHLYLGLWYELPQKRRLGAIILSAGFLSCGLFCVGLRWLY
jgi:hypothetical protein